MRTTKTMLALTALLVGASAALAAQSLDNRHGIELRFGLWNQVNDVRTEIGGGGVSTSVGGSGFLGGLAYSHWLSEGVALRISAGAMALRVETDVGISGVSTETSSITQLLLGVRYYFPGSTYGKSVRPFVAAGAGAFIGSQVATEVGLVVATDARTEPAIGGEVGGGVDFLLSRHFVMSLIATLTGMMNFDQPIGGSDNYSGPQLIFGVGYVFGGGAK